MGKALIQTETLSALGDSVRWALHDDELRTPETMANALSATYTTNFNSFTGFQYLLPKNVDASRLGCIDFSENISFRMIDQIQLACPVFGSSTAALANQYIQEIDFPDDPNTLMIWTNAIGLFRWCRNLQKVSFPEGKGSMLTSMQNMFNHCDSLSSVTLGDTFAQNIVTMYYAFSLCYSLPELTLPAQMDSNNTLTSIANCFSNCSSLTAIHFPPDHFGRNVSSTDSAFYNCTSLQTITGALNLGKTFYLNNSSNLTHDSLLNVLNGLQAVTTAQTIYLGSVNLAKLTDEEKKIAQDKGWMLA